MELPKKEEIDLKSSTASPSRRQGQEVLVVSKTTLTLIVLLSLQE
jgi:hypothetical protein